MEELYKSPKTENKILEDKILQLKERALQRTVHVNLEIKKKTDWTMPKLVENVLTRKERHREERLKEEEQKRTARKLREQLAHNNLMSNVGLWFTKNLLKFTKNAKLNKTQNMDDNLSDTTNEEIRKRDPIIIPLFRYAKIYNCLV